MQICPFIKEIEKVNSILFISLTPQCIISFTGWILEYCVVYVLEGIVESSLDFNHEESSFQLQDTATNCLGNQELKLYRIFLKRIDNNKKKSDEEIRRYIHIFY